jgi:hypothetical protein
LNEDVPAVCLVAVRPADLAAPPHHFKPALRCDP